MDHLRLDWLRAGAWLTQSRIAGYPKLVLVLYALAAVLWVCSLHGGVNEAGAPIGADFVTSFAGSHLALSGHAAYVYSPEKIHAAEQAAIGNSKVPPFGWYYPPTFLVIVLGLALVPYLWALGLWTIVTLGAYLLVVRKIAPWKETIWVVLAFPGTWINLINGQNGFLSAALIGGGLAYLEEAPLFAGALFGLLVFKPHLSIFVPLVLIIGRQWRCFLGMTASALGLIGVSLTMFGTQAWLAFLHSLPLARSTVLDRGLVLYSAQQSVFAALRMWHCALPVAYGVQALVAVVVMIVLVRIWGSTCSYRVKAAALVIGGLLSTPYLFDYDLAAMAVAGALLVSEGLECGFLPFEKAILLLAWLSPILDRTLALLAGIPFGALMNVALFALILARTEQLREREMSVPLRAPTNQARRQVQAA